VSLRAAGIYGPGRGIHVRLRAGTHRVLGAGDSFVNRIHVDDLAATIRAAAACQELLRSVYNVCDDLPATQREVADGVADMLGVPRSPSVDPKDVSPMARAFLMSNRRVRNQRMKDELGVHLAHPTWREGVAQAVAEEQEA